MFATRSSDRWKNLDPATGGAKRPGTSEVPWEDKRTDVGRMGRTVVCVGKNRQWLEQTCVL